MPGTLFETVYDELKVIAVSQLRVERRDHTLQPTALVHEAYLRIARQQRLPDLKRTVFLAIAARVMRQVLIDHARTRRRVKRGAAPHRIPLEKVELSTPFKKIDVEGLDEVLKRLEALDTRQSRIVELRFFGGMTVAEVAEVLSVSTETVKRDWAMARAWLSRELRGA